MNRTVFACLVAALLAPGAALAEDALPPHILRQIQLLVSSSDAIAIVQVDAPPSETSKVALKVEKAIFGELPASVLTSPSGFAPEDMMEGTRLIIPFKKGKSGSLTPNASRYELINEGKVREYPVKAFLQAVEKEVVRKGGNTSRTVPSTRAVVARK